MSDTARERLYAKRTRVRFNYPDRPFCIFLEGRLYKGVDTKHRMPEARRWRQLLRLKQRMKGRS